MATTKKNTKAAAKTTTGKKASKAADGPAKLKRHPLSEKYGPKMDDEELQGLSEDISKHKQHEPIIMYEGMVLAGWNRYNACVMAKVEPKTRELPEGSDPVAVAFGTNFMRRKLSSVQKAFFGAQFAVDTGEKQTDVAKRMGCNLNRLNQCCQLLKRTDDEAKEATAKLRDNPDLGSAQFDEMMLELGIAREAVSRPAPARASSGGGIDLDDDLSDLDGTDDDLTGGAIDNLLDGDEDALNGDDPSPDPAKRKAKSTEVGDDAPLPTTGGKRTKLTNPHETPVSKISSAFNKLDPVEQRKFVKFTWKKLKAALDAAIGGADVEYVPPDVIKADPSRIARNKPSDTLDDGHPTPKKKAGAAKPTPAKKSTGKASKAGAKAPPAKGNGKGKHRDQEI